MKKIYNLKTGSILVLALFFAKTSLAQNVGINATGSAPDASAGLDVSFTNKGFLAPRMTQAQKNAIASPATGLMVYQTDGTAGYYYYTGSVWTILGGGGTSSQWTTNGSNIYYNGGNVGIGSNTAPAYKLQVNATSNPLFLTGLAVGSNTDSLLTIVGGVVKKLPSTSLPASNDWTVTGNTGLSSNYLGTTNATSLRMRTAGVQRLWLDSVGSVAIGSSPTFAAAREKLLVDAGTTTSYNVISGKGSINNYLQLNIQNSSSGTNASSDIVATANNGDETYNFVDMGINSNGNTSNYFGGVNDAYLYSIGSSDPLAAGGNLLIGTSTAGKSVSFLTGGGVAANERMRISGTGNVGIGNTNPTYKLQVNATSNPLFLTGVQVGANTDSVLTISSGVVKKIAPATLVTSSSNAWGLTGSSGTTAGTNFLGTTDSKDFVVKTNNTERMRIMASGDVGIGTSTFDIPLSTSTPLSQPERLHIDAGTYPNSGNQPGLTPFNATGTTNSYVQALVQNKGYGVNSSSDFIVQNDGTRNGSAAVGTDNYYVDFGINSTGYSTNNSNILNQVSTAYLYASTPQDFFIGHGYSGKDIVFFTNYGSTNSNNTADGTEVMRIKGGTSAGTQQVTIGTPTPNGTNKLTVSGNISASAFNVSSDRRLKTNIKPLNYSLRTLMSLRPVTYNWLDPKQSAQTQIGLIAQDTKKIIPEVVTGDESKGMLSINYTELVPVLINAIKEQQAQIDELKKAVQKLQSGTATASVK